MFVDGSEQHDGKLKPHSQRREFIMAVPYFPPLGSSGVQRSTKLALYAQRQGWTPRVLTMRKPPTRQYPRDLSLARQVAHLDVRRLPRIDLRLASRAVHRLGRHDVALRLEWLIPMDGYAGWAPFAIREADRLRQVHAPQLIYTSSYPFSSHLVGWWMKRRHHMPWVADFRDPWTTNDRYPEYQGREPISRWKLWVDRHLEQRILRDADAITVVVEKHRQQLIERFGVAPDKVHTIYNGYDEADFGALPYPTPPACDVFRICFFGRFFLTLNPADFLAMLRAFLKRCDRPDAVRFRVVGEGSQWLAERASEYADIAHHFELMDYVPHARVPALMKEASVLLIIFPKPWSITGKIFEYLRSGLPVFGLGPCADTLMERMLRDAGTGWVVQHQDVDGGVALLERLFAAWEGRTHWPTRPNLEAVTPFSRQRQAGEFLRIFESCLPPMGQ